LASLPAYKAYLCDHHGWEPAVFDLVDWPTFHSCTLTVSFLQRLFIIKWVNDLLPFQTQQHKFNQSPSPLCPSSCGEHEDWRHFPRCPHQARALLWRSFSATITTTFNTWGIDPSLRRLILYWLARYSASDPIPLENLTDDYAMVKTTQEEIGANSILFGYFSQDWVKLQHRYLTTRSLPLSRNQASRGIKAIILQLMEHCHACWLLRNLHLHGTDPRNTSSYKHLQLLAQVTALYESAPFMLSSNRAIFEIPLEARQLQSKSTLQSFYSWASPIVKVSITKAADLGANFRSIDQYFQRPIPPEIFEIILG
jgi:hypothetical protein